MSNGLTLCAEREVQIAKEYFEQKDNTTMLTKFKEIVSSLGFTVHKGDFYKVFISFKLPLKNGYSERAIGIPNGDFTFRGVDYKENEIRLNIMTCKHRKQCNGYIKLFYTETLKSINRKLCNVNELDKLKKYLKRVVKGEIKCY